MDKLKVGIALCGSYCTYDEVLKVIKELCKTYDVTPIMSENTYSTDTRFGRAEDFVRRVEDICGRTVIHTVKDAEPIGPKKLLDLMLVAPCTGNTLSKIANGISDSAVTLAVKAHLRNERPVLHLQASSQALLPLVPPLAVPAVPRSFSCR